ncbi:MAG: carboxypeptidase-like regulatory domain-containing protein, partial [Bacteroidales bacterium]|nr:carboxypeptidase-like regulatory domain-containing protein [Bacteroidales bacterium]
DTLCDAYVSQHPEVKQTRRYIEGYVLDEDDQPLADAWIACDESIMGAATDSTGHFVMWAPRTVTKLYVRHVGYQTICQTIQPADTILNFRMKDATKIKDVEVIPKRRAVSSSSEPSGIDALTTDKQDGKYYDLQGHAIDGVPTEPGIYIVNGKKVMIK